ncbi:MAG: RNA polymerase sigma factor [Gammaproteobacteria bacterium]|nr:RNA polymerase sigma factor [Gammaproteobacteria bacterium]
MVANAQIMAPMELRLSRSVRLAYAPTMDTAPEDSALMLRYRDGDVAAFETLYERHKDALYRYLLRLCRHRDQAEDIFQEVWGKIIKARDAYRPTAKFTTFLYRVAHNCFIDHIRRNKRHTQTIDIEPDSQPDSGEQPEVQTERSLARRRLNAALLELPDEQRDVFLLHEEAGLDLEQIASITGSNRETTKSRLRYAVRKLRIAIDEPVRTP